MLHSLFQLLPPCSGLFLLFTSVNRLTFNQFQLISFFALVAVLVAFWSLSHFSHCFLNFFFLFFFSFLSFYEDQIGLCAIGEFILSRQCSLRWVLKPKSTRDVMKERGRTPHLPHLPRSISPIRYWHLNVLASALSRSQIRLPSASFAYVLYTKHRKIPRFRVDDVRTFLSQSPQFRRQISANYPMKVHDITQVFNS